MARAFFKDVKDIYVLKTRPVRWPLLFNPKIYEAMYMLEKLMRKGKYATLYSNLDKSELEAFQNAWEQLLEDPIKRFFNEHNTDQNCRIQFDNVLWRYVIGTDNVRIINSFFDNELEDYAYAEYKKAIGSVALV